MVGNRTHVLLVVFCLLMTSSGCVSGPGLSLRVDEHLKPASPEKQEDGSLVADRGAILVSDRPLYRIDAFVLREPFEAKIPGTLGVNFTFRISPGDLVLSYQDEKWLYFVADPGNAAAWYNGTSVFASEDEAGIRVSKSDNANREWFVDNSRYNGLPSRGYARWHRNIRSDEVDRIERSHVTTTRDGLPAQWVRFDGESSGHWEFTLREDSGSTTKDRVARIPAEPGATLSGTQVALRIVEKTTDGIVYEVLSGFDGDVASSEEEGERAKRGARTGTCFAVNADGLILTAHHVVSGASRVRVKFEGQAPADANVLKESPASDLAVLEASDRTSNFLPLAPARSTRLGQRVFTIGYPVTDVLGAEPKYSDGTISGLSGLGGEASFLQISVPIQPGNSGGALVDEQGRVVGVVTSTAAALRFLSTTGSLPQNVNWAVKSEMARAFFDPPRVPESSRTRDEVISMVQRATCLVLAE